MRKGLLVLVFLAICPLLAAQQALNNDSVIQLVKAGLSEDLIISTIHASPGTYDTSANGLIALKSAGVSDKVVTAIVVKASAPATMAPIPLPGAAAEPVAANPDDPSARSGDLRIE
jgi:hypothetical protein